MGETTLLKTPLTKISSIITAGHTIVSSHILYPHNLHFEAHFTKEIYHTQTKEDNEHSTSQL